MQSDTLVNNYAHIFELLVRLRQTVCHPYLVVYSAATCARMEGTNGHMIEGGKLIDGGQGDQVVTCGICGDAVEDSVVAECGHSFCRLCLEELLD